jgi:hypothetical protein
MFDHIRCMFSHIRYIWRVDMGTVADTAIIGVTAIIAITVGTVTEI